MKSKLNTAVWILVIAAGVSLVGCSSQEDGAAQTNPESTINGASAESALASNSVAPASDDSPATSPPDAAGDKAITPQQILARIEAIRAKRPSEDEAALRAYLAKTEPELATVAKQAMQTKGIDDITYLAFVDSRIESLAAASILQKPDAAESLDAFVKEMAASSRPAAADKARRFQVAFRFSRATQSATSEAELLAACEEAVEKILAFESLEKGEAQIAGTALRMLESFGKAEQARDAHVRLAANFRNSENPRLAEPFEKAAQRLQLIGNPIEIRGKTLTGETVDMSKYKGKVLLVDFWATWCPPCVAELPNLLKHYEQYHSKGFEVLGVSLDEDQDTLEAFIAKRQIPWPTVFETDWTAQGWKNPNVLRYHITAVPAAILVDQQGRVLTFHARGARLGQLLEELLGPPQVAEAK